MAEGVSIPIRLVESVLGLPGDFAGIAQLVEHNLAKVGVAGSSPVSRLALRYCEVAGRCFLGG